MVLCGGAGTRFWPASRRARPKPFVPLMGGQTLLEATLQRARRLAPAERCWVVSAQSLGRLTRAALAEHPGVRLLLEPEARNTAAAVAWAAACVAGQDGQGVLAVLPADHHIPEPARFVRAIRTAARAAADGEHLVLVGIEPTRADTAYGYLRIESSPSRGVVPVRRFVEKPDLARARRFVRSGDHLWNAGMVVSTASRILAETRAHAPEVWEPLGDLLDRLAAGRRVARARLVSAYRGVRPLSFDHAVLERSGRVKALRGRFRWSDLGSWDALSEHLEPWQGNRVLGRRPVVLIDASDNVIWNDTDKAVALLGVSGLVVIETPDALLVCTQERAPDVRRIVAELIRGHRSELT